MTFYCQDVFVDNLEGRKLLSRRTDELCGHRDGMYLLYSLETLRYCLIWRMFDVNIIKHKIL